MKLRKIIIITLCAFAFTYGQYTDNNTAAEKTNSSAESSARVTKPDNENLLKEDKNDIFSRNSLTDNLWGFGNDLSDYGINLNSEYTSDAFSVLSGGIQKAGNYMDNLDLRLTFDLGKITGLDDITLFIYGLGDRGGRLSEMTGAAQGISNIEAPGAFKLYQLWIEKGFFNDKLSFLFGLFDLNSEFDSKESAGLFINPSHGIGPDFSQAGANGPSIFPTASLAFRVKYRPAENIIIHAAAFDGVAGDPDNPKAFKFFPSKNDGALLTSEIDYVTGEDSFGAGYQKFGAGGWYYTSKFQDLTLTDGSGNPLIRQGNYGVYAFGEKFIYSEEGDDSQGAAVFLRAGLADGNVTQFDFYLGGGITYTGLIPGRDEDVAGIAFASAHNSLKYRELCGIEGLSLNPLETDIEVTYQFQLSGFFSIQPDVQYVFNPADNNVNNYAFLAGVRFKITL